MHSSHTRAAATLHMSAAHFTARPNTYALCASLTGRARCRRCRKRIARGELCFRTHAFVRPGRSATFFRHVGCIDTGFAVAVLAAHSAATIPSYGELDASAVALAVEALQRIATNPAAEARGPA